MSGLIVVQSLLCNYLDLKLKTLIHGVMQVDCDIVKIDVQCPVRGDVVMECINLDHETEREEMMFRIMFNTAFIRSNILMLTRDDIDIMWNAKERYPKEFRAEVQLLLFFAKFSSVLFTFSLFRLGRDRVA